jgi:pimeloyl-ACP methyl ester carboxylesterase
MPAQPMHVVRCGSGQPILFIHGMPTSSCLWTGVMRRLCARYSCFAVDLPGMGHTPRCSYGPGYLRSLADQLDALRREHNIEKWHVVGHDAGSVVAVHYARYYSEHVDHLALLSPALFPELRPFCLIQALRKPLLGELLAPVIQFVFWKIAMHRAVSRDADGPAALDDFYAPFSGFAGAWQFMRLMRWGQPHNLLADIPGFLPELRMPTLLFHGRRDPAIPESFARRASTLLPNARLLSLDAGHFLPLHQPDTIATSLAQFFAPPATA